MSLGRTSRGTQSLAYASQTTATLVSASFTPAAGALLVVLFDEITTDTTPSLTMSTSLTGQGSWTLYQYASTNDGSGNYYTSYIAVSVCGGSPGTGTVTCTRRAGNFSMAMFAEYIEVSGQDATTPITQSHSALGATTSLANNFTTAPVSTSYVFASCINGGGGAAIPTVPTGMTAIGSFALVASNYTAGHAEKLGSAAQNNSWTGLIAFTNGAVAIEIAEAAGGSYRRRWTRIPFALGGARSRW